MSATELEITVEDIPETDDEVVHFACPKAMGDMVVTAYCGFTQSFPYSVWPNSPPERSCVMCVEEHHSRGPEFCPKFGVCQGDC